MKLSETVRNYLQLFQTAGGETVIQGEPGERTGSVNSLQKVKHETIRNYPKLFETLLQLTGVGLRFRFCEKRWRLREGAGTPVMTFPLWL